MIGYLKGSIIDLLPGERALILLAGGVGYRVSINNDLLSNLRTNKEIELFIHTAVREDDIALYGFELKEEVQFFKQLLQVSGVGPKIAMDVLSAPLHLTQSAIVNGDAGFLTKIKGIGKKTAERIILELKSKVIPVTLAGIPQVTSIQEDAILALESLGYDKMHILKVLSGMPQSLQKTPDMVKYFLKTAT